MAIPGIKHETKKKDEASACVLTSVFQRVLSSNTRTALQTIKSDFKNILYAILRYRVIYINMKSAGTKFAYDLLCPNRAMPITAFVCSTFPKLRPCCV